MAYTLWQSAPLAKKPFKKTLEKLEVWGSVFQRAAYSIFLDQQVSFNALSAHNACSEQAVQQLEARTPPVHFKCFL